jgi:predicted nucleic acid-binding protein
VTAVLLDTGPLVAFLSRRDRYHDWARQELAAVSPPLLTCESVVSEACFLLQGQPGGRAAVLELLRRGLVAIAFNLEREAVAVQRLLTRYQDVPMDLADACLVRLAELSAGGVLLTLDSDFCVYRMLGRQVIPVRMPGELGRARKERLSSRPPSRLN